MTFKTYPSFGDKKRTKDYAGNDISKDDYYVILMGKMDFVKAGLDIAKFYVKDPMHKKMFDFLSNKLWQTMGEISLGKVGNNVINPILDEDIKYVENSILLFESPQKFINFENIPSIYINDARTRWRELEPLLIQYHKQKNTIRPEVFAFFNRVSDLLFLMAYYYEVNSVYY